MGLTVGINYRYGMGQMAPDPFFPPAHDQQDPDEAEEDDDDDPHSRPDRTETKNRKHLELLKKLSKILPDKFIFINNTQRDLDDSEASLKIKINPDLTGSWLVTPDPSNDLDSYGLWPASTKFPSPRNNQTPTFEQKVPGHLPAAFEQTKLKILLRPTNGMKATNQ